MDSISDDVLIGFFNTSKCWGDLIQQANMKTVTRKLRQRLTDLNIDYTNFDLHFNGQFTKFNNFAQDEIQEIVIKNESWDTVMNDLGYHSCSCLNKIVERLNVLNIDYTHLPDPTQIHYKQAIRTLDDILVENSTYANMRGLMKKLKNERGWEHRCSICKLTEWNDKSIPLEIDHINGIHSDNRIENLRAICPNCHAQTDTYKGKNMKICKEPKEPKENPEKETKKRGRPKETAQPSNFCVDCNTELSNNRNERCMKCEKKRRYNDTTARKVERPDYETLLKDLETMSFVKVGKKYGVSDNAIRKWLKTYEKYETPN
jgi:hypothetical protein